MWKCIHSCIKHKPHFYNIHKILYWWVFLKMKYKNQLHLVTKVTTDFNLNVNSLYLENFFSSKYFTNGNNPGFLHFFPEVHSTLVLQASCLSPLLYKWKHYICVGKWMRGSSLNMILSLDPKTVTNSWHLVLDKWPKYICFFYFIIISLRVCNQTTH